MSKLSAANFWRHLIGVGAGLLTIPLFVPHLFGTSSDAWLGSDRGVQSGLARYLVAFEARDDQSRRKLTRNRFAGEWALVTHQMTTLGLAQVILAHPELRTQYLPTLSRAAEKSFLPEMRDFGTHAWGGEDVMASLEGSHGHAYMGYPALAVGMARLVGAPLPRRILAAHDRLIAAYVRRLSNSRTGLIETYPGEGYPTDVAAVVGAIGVHGRVTGRNYAEIIQRWARALRRIQIHHPSGFVYQRMNAMNGRPRDAPRGSGTALAAYFAGFADGKVRQLLARGVLAHASTFMGFGGVREYADGFDGGGDVDSGPVVLGVSVSATGFALALARSPAHQETFESLMRTVDLFGLPTTRSDQRFFATGGPIGNALLLALLTSGPEVAP